MIRVRNTDLILIPHPLAAGTKSMGSPKGRNNALPFGRLRSTYLADDIKLIKSQYGFTLYGE